MCKLSTSHFPPSLFQSFIFFLPTRANITLKNGKFLTWYSLVPHFWFRAVDASEFVNFSREKICKSFPYIKHVEKDFATWLGSTLQSVSMCSAKKTSELLQSLYSAWWCYFHLQNLVYRKILKSCGHCNA